MKTIKTSQELAALARSLREAAGLSQTQVGERIGRTIRHVGRAEKGIAPATAALIVAHLLDKEVEQVWRIN